MATTEFEFNELKSLWKKPWTLIMVSDGAELVGAVTRTDIYLRLGSEVVGTYPFSGIDELIDGRKIRERIEEEGGLCLDAWHWRQLFAGITGHFQSDSVIYPQVPF